MFGRSMVRRDDESKDGLTLYRIDEDHPLGWWVKLIDLVPIVGQLPEEILENYEDLGVAEVGSLLPQLVYLNEEGKTQLFVGDLSEDELERVYIDAHWAYDIATAYKAGAVRVEGEYRSHPDPEHQCWEVDGVLGCSFNDDGDCYVAIGIRADGTKITSGSKPKENWKQFNARCDAEDEAARRVSHKVKVH